MRITIQASVFPKDAEEFIKIQKEYKENGKPASVLFNEMMTAFKAKKESDEIK